MSASIPKIKKGYKQTEIGVIPEDWEVKRLGDVCEKITTGKLNANAMVDGGEYRFYTCAEEYYRIDQYAFDTEALLVSGNGANVGYVHYYKGKFNAYQRTYVLSDFVDDIQYVKLFLDRNLQERIRVEVNAGNTPYITMGTLTEMQLTLPKSKPEQKAIAEALSDTDVLIEKLSQLISKRKAVKLGTMQQLLTGRKRLAGFSGEWEVNTIEELEKKGLLKLLRGKVISKKDIESIPGRYPIYSSSVHNNGEFGCYGEFMFDEELITWSVDGGGNFFYRPRHRFSVTNVCGYMRVDRERILYKFLATQLQLLHGRLFFDYTMKAHPSIIRKAYTVLLPTIEEQSAIATILSDMDTEIEALEKERAKYQAIKQGMMQTLLIGKIRLVTR